MQWYHELYDIETRGKVMSLEERLELRQTEAKPIWDAMAVWLEEVKLRSVNVLLPKSDFAKALQYIRNHFTELRLYLDDASLPIDNNETEQLMKQIGLGRKNWLFVGSVAAGQRSAGFMTLVSSALRNDLDVWQYIKDVLDQLLSGVTDYEPMLPWNWAASHPEAIRKYRVDERQDRADRQQQRRADRRRRKNPKARATQ
jgi:transposase